MRPSPRNILLTGAGFTKNFGGLLGHEVWKTIFNHPKVRDHRRLMDLLEELEPDFETAYSRVMKEKFSDDEKAALVEVVKDVFEKMDDTLRRPSLSGKHPSIYGISDLIGLFAGEPEQCGFFFTLNQDLFVERSIMSQFEVNRKGHLHPLGIPRRRGYQGDFLGDRPLSSEEIKQLPVQGELDSVRSREERHARFAYVKLHGSTGWVSSIGRSGMVIGGGKETQIEQEPILEWYFQLFREIMLERRHRLLVIGFSFRDPHINRVLVEAIDGPGLDVAVISPRSFREFKESLRAQAFSNQEHREDVECLVDTLKGRGSRFFSYQLIDIFPPDARGDKTAHWLEIREYLTS